ncbi:hypothetical protein CC2G_002644 [Coprinopsis cinerea AmutBmut pab1-1]|nr:hypothetical protein CC2G_002644 [Coprinopsis cinerea AmutBmut pab1-1]KAG2006321.1 hypothetical protein CC2G_002644 [Coprinopsis cinerea AmutBmut pab1-1]
MLLNFKALAVTLFASLTLVKAYSSYEPYYERDLVDGDDFHLASRDYETGLYARSHINRALSSLTTRALLNELNDRLERRGRGTAAEIAREEAIARCRRILANAAGTTIEPNALWPLEECLKKLFDLEGVMPVANWKVGPARGSTVKTKPKPGKK